MPEAPRGRSIAFRLLAGGILWIVLALGAGGLGLSFLFRGHVERVFDARLEVLLETLIAAAEMSEDGTELAVGPLPGEPRFARPYSGWYWQVSGSGGIEVRSRSLWDQALPLATPGGGTALTEVAGPGGERLRVLERDITLPGLDAPLRFAVAAETGELARELRGFQATLWIALGALGAGLAAALFAQVRYGLRPLRAVRAALAGVREGRTARIAGALPAEVGPLVDELNALLDHNADMLERMRRHVGNLAHALKGPLTVLTNAGAGETGSFADIVRAQTDAMRRDVEHHGARARAAGAARLIGARTPLAPIIDRLKETLLLLHAERPVAIAVAAEGAATFGGEQHDLEEMLGNLLDNACKWAAHQVRLSVRVERGRLELTVDDDGPGIELPARTAALERGRRLDETTPGEGLGLAIVDDLAALYGGALALGDSPLGGLRARLELPAAPGS